MSLYKTYKSGEGKFDQVDWMANSETWDEDIKQFRKQEYISIIKGEIERLESKKKPILDKIDAEDNKYWKVNRNSDMGYNKCIQDQISHLQSELKAIEEENI